MSRTIIGMAPLLRRSFFPIALTIPSATQSQRVRPCKSAEQRGPRTHPEDVDEDAAHVWVGRQRQHAQTSIRFVGAAACAISVA